MHRLLSAAASIAAIFCMAAPAAAADVTLSASLVNSCVLTVNSGAMTISSDGMTLGSEQSGGSAASMSVVVVGTLPTISFSAPSLTASPPGWSASPTNAIRYTSTQGANQGYTSAASSVTQTALLDTFTVHGRVVSNTGFAAGNYTLRTVATCQQ